MYYLCNSVPFRTQIYRFVREDIIEKCGDIVEFLNGLRKFEPVKVDLVEIFRNEANKYDVDFSDVRGQENVKRALELAAAGGHNLIIMARF